MSTPELDKYKVDHLFLLIGENPLPNYVAAKLLVNKGGTVYLVHTRDTEDKAKRLQGILIRSESHLKTIQLWSIEDYESDAHNIRVKINEVIEKISNGKIGLNYTGGTKAMSVHSYRTLFYEEIEENNKNIDKIYKQRSNLIFSYLDPRNLEMCIDRENKEIEKIKIEPNILQVDIQTIFELHGWKWHPEPAKKPEQPKAAQVFAEFHAQEDSLNTWKNWCVKIFRPVTKDTKSNWLEDQELKKVPPLNLDILQCDNSIINALHELGLTGEELSLQTLKENGFKNIKQVCKWLDGEWLEHYVLQKVQEISENLLIHDSATSFWMATYKNPKQNKFQFDVAFMRGYQLFAISCTTDQTKQLCKSKLFEAYIRAQQLGGSEARVALVCCANKKDVLALRTEITNVFSTEPDSQKKDEKIAVFGREHLLNLSQEIADWIRNNEAKKK
ncbi:hypothetical protein SR1949_08750 [Sphaerospermopsis reniformis]|uniref:DUF1887 family protein n=1 Tax=Sphaerospermopsis reniformis TaxID=531300 RepID=A0A479ZW18_9CYAN|nr:DUF1887 family CARF protein [Sphaerospermopsis reniformis]GCL35776.1 hypothetical protein SR1949_08750 [Sphaerospermopsis reniformis]